MSIEENGVELSARWRPFGKYEKNRLHKAFNERLAFEDPHQVSMRELEEAAGFSPDDLDTISTKKIPIPRSVKGSKISEYAYVLLAPTTAMVLFFTLKGLGLIIVFGGITLLILGRHIYNKFRKKNMAY